MTKRVADDWDLRNESWGNACEDEDAEMNQQAEDEMQVSSTVTARSSTNAEEPKSRLRGFCFTNTNAENQIFGQGASKGLFNQEETKSKNILESSEKISNTDNVANEFYSQLKKLNESLSCWVQKHVDADPLCILTPIFNDYIKHFSNIEAKRQKLKDKDKSTASDETSLKCILSPAPVSNDIFKAPEKSSIIAFLPSETNKSAKPVELLSSNSAKDEMKAEEPKKSSMMFGAGSATFSFGNSFTSQGSLPTVGFSFGAGAPFTFGNIASQVPKTVSKPNTEEEPDEDAPPKVEFKPVIEEDSVYTIRCKIFIKKDESYVDGGIGNLFLKPIKDINKTQLIVRADTNLGNLLINVLLTESIPAQRMGKNNVMMVCVPTPDKSPKPASILLRVKTAEDADELLEMINKYKS